MYGSVGLGCLWNWDRNEFLARENIHALAGYSGRLSVWEVRTWKLISFRRLILESCRRSHHLPATALWNIGISHYKLRWSQLLEPLPHLVPSLYLMFFQSESETLFALVCQSGWVSNTIILCAASVGTLSKSSIFEIDSAMVCTINSKTLSGVHTSHVLTINRCCDCGSTILGILYLHGLCHADRLHLFSDCRVLYRCLRLIGARDRLGSLNHIIWILDLLEVHWVVWGATATRLL